MGPTEGQRPSIFLLTNRPIVALILSPQQKTPPRAQAVLILAQVARLEEVPGEHVKILVQPPVLHRDHSLLPGEDLLLCPEQQEIDLVWKRISLQILIEPLLERPTHVVLRQQLEAACLAQQLRQRGLAHPAVARHRDQLAHTLTPPFSAPLFCAFAGSSGI